MRCVLLHEFLLDDDEGKKEIDIYIFGSMYISEAKWLNEMEKLLSEYTFSNHIAHLKNNPERGGEKANKNDKIYTLKN